MVTVLGIPLPFSMPSRQNVVALPERLQEALGILSHICCLVFGLAVLNNRICFVFFESCRTSVP